ncbi:MAG: hypothetical protein AMXMBFR13_42570 [Phycisphaerae bacterium]
MNWRVTGGQRVRAIHYPADQADPTHQAVTTKSGNRVSASSTASPVYIAMIDSPPIDGFVPWISVVATDQRDEPLATSAVPHASMTGDPFVADPASQYAIGLFDTGASASVIGYQAGQQMGLFSAGAVTTNEVTVQGVTGSVQANLSIPMALFIDGLGAIDPSTLSLSLGGLRGESNISAVVAKPPDPGAPDLVTAIGSPMAVFLTAVIQNHRTVSRTIGGNTYTAPIIRFFRDSSDPEIPIYPYSVALELRPEGGFGVEYMPCVEIYPGDCPGGGDNPTTPSMVGFLGFPLQSLFFISQSTGVDLSNNGNISFANDGFMLDTGAQVTVISSGVASRLRLNPNQPDFQVEIQGVDGQIVLKPGFYVDTLDIPALGEWLSYTNVPVVLLDVASPEGNILDGIIGMNLFVDYNLVFQGGGLFGQGAPPVLRFYRIVFGDYDGDADVDLDDFGAFQLCLSGPAIPHSAPDCSWADADKDGDVDQADFGVFQRCLSGPEDYADPACGWSE